MTTTITPLTHGDQEIDWLKLEEEACRRLADAVAGEIATYTTISALHRLGRWRDEYCVSI